jgi:hypothetical protein
MVGAVWLFRQVLFGLPGSAGAPQWMAMGSGPAEVAALIAGIDPFDDTERLHRSDALGWLAGTQDIYRRVKPATPSRHLVSYAVLAEPGSGGVGWNVFLVDHILAGLRLPPGVH